ncbi:MAG: NAD(P)H-binding protein [Atopobiaceae bacterium]|nr:NAD(P)H-binding protein [Atopobiaceae bacterium]
MNIMVTGATGHYGKAAIKCIRALDPSVNVFGLVHTPKKAAKVEKLGATPRMGDYADKDSLVKAFEGIDRVLFVSVLEPKLHKNVAEAAKEAGVGYIAYTSMAGLDFDKFGTQKGHIKTENWITETGIPHTFLRDGWFLELEHGIMAAAQKTGKFRYMCGDAKLSMTLRREFAEAGAKAILRGEENPEVITLTRTGFTYAELGAAIAEALGGELDIAPCNADEFKAYLDEAGLAPIEAALSSAYQGYALAGNNGEDLTDQAEFEALLGHPLTTLAEACKEVLGV